LIVVFSFDCSIGTHYDIATDTCIPCTGDTFQDYNKAIVCAKCFPLCSSCTGPLNTQCNGCKPVPYSKPFISNTCECERGFYFTNTPPIDGQYCQPCHPFCTSCVDSSTNCQSCIEQDGIQQSLQSCKCLTTEGYYIGTNEDGLEFCSKCHILCTSCFGPNFNQCKICDIRRNVTMIADNECGCSSGYYYNIEKDSCSPCNSLCKGCTGPSASECRACDTNIALTVEGNVNLCVSDCGAQGFYKEGTACKKCNKECLACYGPNPDNCLQCADPTKYSFKNSCVSDCEDGYYKSTERTCNQCHPNCLTCNGGSSASCASCYDSNVLYESSCLFECPQGSYEAQGKACTKCKEPCKHCVNSTTCTTCVEGYFYHPIYFAPSHCSETCFDGTYGDELTQKCLECHFTCKTCIGPSDTQCVECNQLKGLVKQNNLPVGRCLEISCPSGYYPSINIIAEKASCEKCHKSCKECTGPIKTMCTSCNIGFFDYLINGNLECRTCEEISRGLTYKNGKCKEICGDGINMGQLECDDGNTLSADGCSSECKIEEGFDCHLKNDDGANICIDVLPPKAELIVKGANKLEVTFTEKVTIKAKTIAELINSTKITISGNATECPFTWSFTNLFNTNDQLSNFQISLDLECSLRGKAETFTINFTDPQMISDPGNNKLYTPVIEARAQRFLYIPNGAKQALAGAGNFLSASSLATLILVVGVNLLQSAALESFWAFINMLQILSYIPVINCVMPYNLEVFLTEYLSVSKMNFPFYLFYGWIPNPFSFIPAFLTNPFNDKFLMAGYKSLSFIYNFLEQLITWVILGVFYCVLRILTYFIPEERCKFVWRWRREYEYNTVLRVLIECYMHMVFCSFLNIWALGVENTSDTISLLASGLAAFLAIGFLTFSTHLVENSDYVLLSIEFKESFGTIIDSIHIEKDSFTKGTYVTRYFYPFYLLRRIVYSAILITLIDAPNLQLSLIPIIVIFPMVFYYLYFTPFCDFTNNWLNIYNEALIALICLSLLIINVFGFGDQITEGVGWFLVTLIMLSLLATWVLLLPNMIRDLISTIKEWFGISSNPTINIIAPEKQSEKLLSILNKELIEEITKTNQLNSINIKTFQETIDPSKSELTANPSPRTDITSKKRKKGKKKKRAKTHIDNSKEIKIEDVISSIEKSEDSNIVDN